MPCPPKTKRPAYLWVQQMSRVTLEQLEKHLDPQPVFATTTSQLQRCQLWLGNIDGHHSGWCLYRVDQDTIVYGDGEIKCVSPWSSRDGHRTVFNRMTLQLKRYTKNLAATGAKPMAIMSDMIDQLNLTEDTVPSLGQVQRTAYYQKKWYRDALDETTPFTFAWPINDFGIPVIGNGSETEPFLIGVTTKRQVRGLFRAAEFPLHIDTIYKLNQLGDPMVVCGTSDANRSIHVATVFFTSHLCQEQYSPIFSSMFAVYQLVTGIPLEMRYVMGAADDAQFNGFAEVFVSNCPSATYLMCFFHVMLNVKKKTKKLSDSDQSLVYKHVYRIHHARYEFDATDERMNALRAWSARPTLKEFTQYFKQERLTSRIHRWHSYQSAIGHAKTNNPLEQFNKAFKRDCTLRQLLPLNSLMLKIQQLCKTKAVAFQDFKDYSDVTSDI